MNIAIIIPIVRMASAMKCIEAIKENAGYDNYSIIAEQDTKQIGCPKMVKKLVEKSPKDTDAFCFLGDDTIPQKDFLKNAVEAMKAIPGGKGLVTFNDNPTAPISRTHWLAHRDLLNTVLDGEFFHTGYKHSFCDDELFIRCSQVGKFMYAYNAVLIHDHPAINKRERKEGDDHYDRVYSEEYYTHDEDLFNKRISTQWGKVTPIKQTPQEKPIVAILLPTMDQVQSDFAVCLANAVSYAAIKGMRLVIIKHTSSLLPVSRCELIAQAQKVNAKKIIFLDSDMYFPYTTIIDLLTHNQPVVCVDAARKEEPLRTVLKDKDGNPLDHNKELEHLVEVESLATGVALLDSSVFDKISKPYFNIEYNDGVFTGEDYYLGYKLKEAGYKILCDTKLSKKIGHIGVKKYTI